MRYFLSNTAMKKSSNLAHPIANCLNLALLALTVTLSLLTNLILPWLAAPLPILFVFILIDLIALRLTNLRWHLLHEAIHGMLFSSRRWNEWAGRIMGLLLFSAFSILRFGHLNHHRSNRYGDTSEVYYDRDKPGRLQYYADILGVFFLKYEWLPLFAAWVPVSVLNRIITRLTDSTDNDDMRDTYNAVSQFIASKKMRRVVRFESFASLAFLALCFYAYGAYWPILLGVIAVRAMLLSYLDNMPHYRNTIKTDINAADNAYLPPFLSACYLHFNYHRVHHCFPKVPWKHLPKKFVETEDDFHCDYIKSYLEQLKGPVYFADL